MKVHVLLATGYYKCFNSSGTVIHRNAFMSEPTAEQKESFLAECKKDTGSLRDFDPEFEIKIDVVQLEVVDTRSK